jgi:hypothetical protein
MKGNAQEYASLFGPVVTAWPHTGALYRISIGIFIGIDTFMSAIRLGLKMPNAKCK